jgi:hypothetical protein
LRPQLIFGAVPERLLGLTSELLLCFEVVLQLYVLRMRFIPQYFQLMRARHGVVNLPLSSGIELNISQQKALLVVADRREFLVDGCV